jgi:hypothetical protein
LFYEHNQNIQKRSRGNKTTVRKDGIYYTKTNILQHFAPLPRAQAAVQLFYCHPKQQLSSNYFVSHLQMLSC